MVPTVSTTLNITDVRTRGNQAGGGYRYPYDKPRKTRLFIFPEGESVWANLANRRERPADLYRQLLPAIYEQAGIPAGTKARWSQKAGCSCPCSPGFILAHVSTVDVYVTVTGEEHPTRDEARIASAVMGLRAVTPADLAPVDEVDLAWPS